jgi:hypothetical protein
LETITSVPGHQKYLNWNTYLSSEKAVT